MKISEWADQYRILSSESSAEGGSRWHTDRAEYLRGIMDAVSNKLTEIVTLMKSSQTGGTEIALNIIGYYIHQDPSPIIDVEPDDDAGKEFGGERFGPMVRDTSVLTRLVDTAKGRSSRNTIKNKSFPGGNLAIVGARSPQDLAGRPKRILIGNDVDRWPATCGTEGEPLELALKRLRTFWNRKVFINSSPTTKDISRIERYFYMGSQEHWFVPCPFCGYKQKLIFSNTRSQFKDIAKGMLIYEWKDSIIKSVHYQCENCGGKIPETAKLKMIRNGEWRAQFPDRIKHRSFHISELMSPWSSWADIAEGFERAKHTSEMLRVWINTTTGETFDEAQSHTITGNLLYDRREEYSKIPAGVIFLTAFIDVQPDRLECYVEGWMMGEENYYIKSYIAEGSYDDAKTWASMEAFLFDTIWEHENGYKAGWGELGGLMAVGIDSGFQATKIYERVRAIKRKRVYATKGTPGWDQPIQWESKSKKVPVRLINIGVDVAKQLVIDRLNNKEVGAGYQHFNQECTMDYFDQLLSERKKLRRDKRGFEWVLLPGRRNEALDCKVGNLAIFKKFNANLPRYAEMLKAQIEVWKETKNDQPKEINQEQTNKTKETKSTPKPRRRFTIRMR